MKSTRWTATINYVVNGEVKIFHHDIEEVEELQDIIERTDDWNDIDTPIHIGLIYNRKEKN